METDKLTDKELSLLKYIPNVGRLKTYVERMIRAKNMEEVESHVLIPMLLSEPNVTKDNSERKDFYTRLRPFIKELKGSSNTALYERICGLNTMLRKENRHKQSFAGMLQQIKVPLPNPGEETRCIVELVITPSAEEEGRMVTVTATLAGMECRKVTDKHFDGETGVNVPSTSYIIKGSAGQLAALLGQMRAYWEDEELSVRYISTRIDRDKLTLSQAMALAENGM